MTDGYAPVYFPLRDKTRHDARVAAGEELAPFAEYVRALYYAARNPSIPPGAGNPPLPTVSPPPSTVPRRPGPRKGNTA